MKINVKATLAKEAERKAQVKPLPKVTVAITATAPSMKPKEKASSASPKLEIDDHLLTQLYADFGALKRERGKLSTQTSYLVANIEKRLREESPALANEFLKGNLPDPDLIEHYNKIQSLTEQGAIIWDDIRHIKEHGKPKEKEFAPAVIIDNGNSAEVKAIKHERTRLKDLICKCKAKIDKATSGLKPPKNSARVLEWKEKISLAEASRFDLNQKLKRLQA